MALRDDLREFLISRRAKLTPADVGLPDFGGRRRVVGLRREEVALVAGISVEYYVRLERGNATGMSEGVIEGISRALKLDEAERAHLQDLVRASNASSRSRPSRGSRGSGGANRGPVQHVPEGVLQLLAAMRDVPAYVQNGRLDVLAVNQLGAAVFAPVLVDSLRVDPLRRANFARFVFLDPAAGGYFRDWDRAAQQTVAILRAEAGRSPHDRALSDLVGQLATRSDPFRRLWASHDVREHRAGTKDVTHPVVGDLDLEYEALDVGPRGAGFQLIAFTARPGSPTDDALKVLASYAASDPAASSPVASTPPPQS